MNAFLLDLLAFAAVLSGVFVITAKNPVISVLFLIAVFINVAGYLVLLGVAYLGLAYLIIYIGAIAVLFLFVIMMLNLRLVELIDTGQEYTQNLPLGAMIGGVFLFELLSILPENPEQSGFSPYTAILDSGLGVFSTLNTVLLGVGNHGEAAASAASTSLTAVHTAYNPMSLDLTSFLQIESIGMGLYTYVSLWLLVASLIFLLAMVGPILLCLSPRDSH